MSSGEIFPDSNVIITDESGYIIRYTRVSTIDYGFISKSPIPKSAKKDWNVGLLLKEITLEELIEATILLLNSISN